MNDELTVTVKRNPQDHDYQTATYKLEDFSRPKWDRKSGGIMRPFNDYYICGYVYCNEAMSGEVAHSCLHGTFPHEIKVCVIKKYTDKESYKILLEIVGEKPKWIKLK